MVLVSVFHFNIAFTPSALASKNEILTGLLFVDPDSHDLHHLLQTNDKPLNSLGKDVLCPGAEALVDINAGLR